VPNPRTVYGVVEVEEGKEVERRVTRNKADPLISCCPPGALVECLWRRGKLAPFFLKANDTLPLPSPA